MAWVSGLGVQGSGFRVEGFFGYKNFTGARSRDLLSLSGADGGWVLRVFSQEFGEHHLEPRTECYEYWSKS